jgi:hypothetical protein
MPRDFALAIPLYHPEPVEGPLILASVSEKMAARKGKVRGSSTPLRSAQNDKNFALRVFGLN